MTIGMLGGASKGRCKHSLLFSSAKSLKRNRMMRQKRATHELYDMEGIAKVLSFDDVDGDGPIGGDSRV